jgi:glucose/mannose transport system permease protein
MRGGKRVAEVASAHAVGSLTESAAQLKARGRRRRAWTLLPAVIGTLPMAVTAVGGFIIAIIFTVIWSFTSSKLFPNFDFVGFQQYVRLWSTPKWLQAARNIWVYGFLHISVNMIFGYLLAVFMDQRIRQEDAFRTIFLYPFALSAVITGLVWQWMMDPNLGIQSAVNNLGWTDFRFAPISDKNTALYGMVVAGMWNGTGVIMAIMLAGLRGVDEEIWKAAKIDGIPTWRTYLFIVLPMMRGAVATALILQTVATVRTFDIVIAMTGGGPGIATVMPAVYVIENINARNVAHGMAAATCLLIPVLLIILLQMLFRWNANRRKRRAA